MDSTDQKILEILREDGRASFTEVAEKVGVSEGTVRNRVRDLKEKGIIQNFTVEISNQGMSAIILVKLSTDALIEEVLESFPENIRVFEVTGEHDIIIHLTRTSSEKLNDELDKIRKINGVEDTVTQSVLKDRDI